MSKVDEARELESLYERTMQKKTASQVRRERNRLEVLRLKRQGKTSQQVANELEISRRTVTYIIKNAKENGLTITD